MSDLTERIVTEVCAALVPPAEWGTETDEKPGWIGHGLDADAHAAAAAALRAFALHMPGELREHIQFVAAELVLTGPAISEDPAPPDRSGRWIDGQLQPFGPRDLDGWTPANEDVVAGD